MENFLLTDFNTERWNGINLESVEEQLEKLNERIKISGYLFGEIGNPFVGFEISLTSVSHSIKNLTFNDGKIYGDVKFLDNLNGKLAENYIHNMNYMFGIRSAGKSEDGKIIIKKILTWDVIQPNPKRKLNLEDDPWGEENWGWEEINEK